MRTQVKDETGKTYGRLRVLVRDGNLAANGTATWTCLCSCGNKRSVTGVHLRSGHTTSCGCKQTQHGLSAHPLYLIWQAMHRRCDSPGMKDYFNYGGRGITVCPAWGEFVPFLEWSTANGYVSGLTIDRINNDGNYEPENCRWATRKEQGRNVRKNVLVRYEGVEMTLAEAAERSGIGYSALYRRMVSGWPEENLFDASGTHGNRRP